jgi:pantothenate kinase
MADDGSRNDRAIAANRHMSWFNGRVRDYDDEAPTYDWDLGALGARARDLAGRAPRVVLGITGPPGAGKSTLAAQLAGQLGAEAALVQMDGFHLAQVELERLGRSARKGAPDTFDVRGYVALLARLREEQGETVYAPTFRRDIEEPIAGAIAVGPEVRVVVTEGNYLLDSSPPWDRVRLLLDEAWYLEVGAEVRTARLVARHMAYGRTEAEAKSWVRDVDQANAVRIEDGRRLADLVMSARPRFGAEDGRGQLDGGRGEQVKR